MSCLTTPWKKRKKKKLLTCRTFSFHCIKKKTTKAKFDSVALMYIQNTSSGISKLRFTPDKRGMGLICLHHLF